MTGREGDDRPGCVGRSRLASSDICGAEHREANLFAERNATVVSPLDLEVTQALRRLPKNCYTAPIRDAGSHILHQDYNCAHEWRSRSDQRLECTMRVSFIFLAARPSGNLVCLGYVGLKLAPGFLGLLIELLKNGFLSCSGPGIG
jgi:hypothetical protein